MNEDNLHELIHRYTMNYDSFIDAQHDEMFKWRAVKSVFGKIENEQKGAKK